MNAVEFQGVSKSYAIYESPGDRFKELLSLNRLKRHRDFLALSALTFQVKRGETFCIVGENGSGKSTLLQMVAGILHPSAGTLAVNGRVSALLELGAGFNPEFTGRDNVYLNGSILGLTTRQVDQRYRDIETFAEIGEFINQPVKTYSSGMVVRLAFAVAINVDPEILLVDEALAVGDIYFRQRCMRKVHELRSRGITILFVSHAASDVKAIGDRVLWLDHGRMRELGEPDRVIAKYLAAMTEKDSAYLLHKAGAEERRPRSGPVLAPEIVETIPNIDHRYGDGRAHVIGIAVLDERGHPVHLLEPCARIVVRISVRAAGEVPLPMVGFMLRNQLGIDFSGTNTAREGHELPPLQAGDVCTVDFHVELPELYPASFSFSPAIADGTLLGYTMCDWIDNAVTLQMSRGPLEIYGYMHLPCRVEVNARLAGADGAGGDAAGGDAATGSIAATDPAPGNPAADRTATTNTAAGNSASGRTATTDTAAGNPASGRTATTDTAAGNPAARGIATTDTAAGNPAARGIATADTAPGNPAAGRIAATDTAPGNPAAPDTAPVPALENRIG